MANMRNPMREYMPEHAMSTTKGGKFGRTIAGVPYCSARLTCNPIAFRIMYAACELTMDIVEPKA